jgi:hypothetical protein
MAYETEAFFVRSMGDEPLGFKHLHRTDSESEWRIGTRINRVVMLDLLSWIPFRLQDDTTLSRLTGVRAPVFWAPAVTGWRSIEVEAWWWGRGWRLSPLGCERAESILEGRAVQFLAGEELR